MKRNVLQQCYYTAGLARPLCKFGPDCDEERLLAFRRLLTGQSTEIGIEPRHIQWAILALRMIKDCASSTITAGATNSVFVLKAHDFLRPIVRRPSGYTILDHH